MGITSHPNWSEVGESIDGCISSHPTLVREMEEYLQYPFSPSRHSQICWQYSFDLFARALSKPKQNRIEYQRCFFCLLSLFFACKVPSMVISLNPPPLPSLSLSDDARPLFFSSHFFSPRPRRAVVPALAPPEDVNASAQGSGPGSVLAAAIASRVQIGSSVFDYSLRCVAAQLCRIDELLNFPEFCHDCVSLFFCLVLVCVLLFISFSLSFPCFPSLSLLSFYLSHPFSLSLSLFLSLSSFSATVSVLFCLVSMRAPVALAAVRSRTTRRWHASCWRNNTMRLAR